MIRIYIYEDYKRVQMDNNVEWFGLNPNKYTNAVSINDVKIGDTVYVFTFDNYGIKPKQEPPIKTKIINIDPHPYIIVHIEGRDYEIYESGFGHKIK